MLTVSQVKRDLPDVPVRMSRKGKTIYAKVSGRCCPYALVTLAYIWHGKGYLRGVPWIDQTFSWGAVANAINTGKPLQFDS